ncbi:hypothetical protein QAD02_005107, partial [Eretmocerus hayati]
CHRSQTTSPRNMDTRLLLLTVVTCLLFSTPTVISLDGKVSYAESRELDFVAAFAYSHRHIPRVFNVFCSGVLVTRRHVLTNEHCVNDEKLQDFVIYIGSHNLQEAEEHTACDSITYQEYLERTGRQPFDLGINDIAIVKLCRSIYSQTLQPPGFSWSTTDTAEECKLTISGWGLARDQRVARLQKGTVELIDPIECEKQTKLRAADRRRVLCTTASPFVLGCSGDSGGPILDRENRIAGITTCLFAETEDPDEAMNLHVNVTFYKEFITNVVTGSLYLQYSIN